MSLNETKLYSNMVFALEKTIHLQKEIDLLYPEVEKKTRDF